jgi:hypothetical protein
MAISPDLFMAILAMDAYNRGYNAGLNLGPAQLQIGNATLRQDALPQGYEAASFFAQAYALADGSTVISYRGTDSNLGLGIPVLSGDLANGYGLALGAPYGPQATMAIDFYKAVSNG